MITRRSFSSMLALGGMSGTLGGGSFKSAKAAETNDDGLHIQPFFIDSFLDLAEDRAEAEAAGKHLAIFFEQRGCPYCKQMHEVNLAKPEIRDFITQSFSVLQLNLYGSREVTDFDGKALEERALARRWFVNFTPTIVFFPNGELEKAAGPQIEAIRMPGYFKPYHFISMFEFVHEEAFKENDFQRWLQAKTEKLREQGRKVDLWAD